MGFSKRRVFGIVLKAGLVLLLLTGTALFLYLRSASFQDRVRSEIVTAIEGKFPVRVELQSVQLHIWGARLELKGLRIFNRLYPADEPAIDLDDAEINFSIISFVNPAASLDAVDLNMLRVRVVEDANGRLNLWNMFRNRDDKPPKLTALIRLAIKEMTIRDGLIQFLDRSFHLESSKGGMDIEMRFVPDKESYAGKLDLTGLDLGLGSLRLQQLDAALRFTLFENRIEFPGVELKSRQVGGTASGAIEDLGELVYRFQTDFVARPAEIASPPLDRLIDQGEVRLAGTFTGQKSAFGFTGSLRSVDLLVRDLPLQDVDAKIRADSTVVTVEEATARLHGGTVQARGELHWDEPALSRFELQGSGVRLGPLVRLLDPAPLQVGGSSGFQGSVEWPGLRFEKLHGAGTVSCQGQFSFAPAEAAKAEPPLQFPFEGRAGFGLNNAGVEVAEGAIETLGGGLLVEGKAGFDATYNFDVVFQAPAGSEAKVAAMASGFFDPEPLESYSVRLGATRLQANLSGSGRDLHVTGSLSANDVGVRGLEVGDFQTLFDWSRDRIELTNLDLKGKAGSWNGSLRYLLRAPAEAASPDPVESAPRLDEMLLSIAGVDVGRLAEVAGFDLDAAGTVSAQVRLEEDRPGHYRGGGTVDVVGPAWNGIRLDSAAGRIDLDGVRLLIDDMRVRLDPAGSVSGRVSLDLESGDFDGHATGSRVALSALDDLVEGRLGALEGEVDFSLTASGTRDAPKFEGTVHSDSLRYGEQELTALKLTVGNGRSGGGEAAFRIEAGVLGERVTAGGTFGLRAPYPIETTAMLSDFPLAAALAQLPLDTDVTLGGLASGTVSLNGTLSQLDDLDIEGVFTRLRLTMADYQIENRNNVTLILKSNRLRILPLTMVGKETELNVSGTVELDGQRAVNIKTSGQANLLLLNTFLPGGATFGQLNLETVVTGTLDAPKIVGQADLSKGFLRHPDVPTTVFDAAGKFRFTADQIAVDQFSARTTYGTINAEGGIFLAGLTPIRWLINVSGEGLRLEYPEKVVSTLDVDVDWINNEETQLLSGVVYVRSSEYKEQITLPELILRYGTGNALLGAPVTTPDVTLDIEVEGYRTLHIENNLANVTASGDFKIRGTLSNPVLLGSLTVDEGKLFLENNEYQVNRGTITFNDPRATRPVFNFEAETEVRDFSVSVILQGPIDQLNATFRSDPPLAASSIVSLLAVGQTQEEIFGAGGSQGQAGSLAIYGAGALLSKSLGKRLEAQTSRLFGFDKLSIDPFLYGSERDPGARVTLGKSLGKNVTVTYSTDLGNEGQGQIVVVEVKLTDWLTAVGTGEQNGSVAIDFKLRKRF